MATSRAFGVIATETETAKKAPETNRVEAVDSATEAYASSEAASSDMEEEGLFSDEGDTTDNDTSAEPTTLRAYWWRLPFGPFVFLFCAGQIQHIIRGPFATKYEQRMVKEAEPRTPMALVHYFAWRRAMISSILVVGCTYYLLQLRVLVTTYVQRGYFYEVAHQPGLQSYASFEENMYSDGVMPSFITYTMKKAWALLAHIFVDVLDTSMILEVIACLLNHLPLIMLVLAMVNWTNHTKSRRYVLAAFGISLLIPIMVSIFPMRYMVSFKALQPEMAQYVEELAVALHLDAAQKFMVDTCQELESHSQAALQKRIQTYNTQLQGVCTSLTNMPLQFLVPCGGVSLCSVDMTSAIDGCRQAILQFETGHIDRAAAIGMRVCNNIRNQMRYFIKKDGEGQFGALVDMIRMPFKSLIPDVGLTAITISVFRALFHIFPAVATIGPGMMRAGIATKMLLPHSALPGALIIFVPCIIIASLLTLDTVIFQYISDWRILLALVCFLLEPCVLALIFAYYQVTEPTTSEKLDRAIYLLSYTSLVILSGFFIACCFIYWESGNFIYEILQDTQWLQVYWGTLWSTACVGVLYFFMLTSFGITDYMVSDISAQQRYWRYWGERYHRQQSLHSSNGFLDHCARPPGLEPGELKRQYSARYGAAEVEEQEDDIFSDPFAGRTVAQQEHDLRALFRHRIDCELREDELREAL